MTAKAPITIYPKAWARFFVAADTGPNPTITYAIPACLGLSV